MLLNNIYYSVKPFIPRSLQIFVRRKIVARKRRFCADVWPIDEKAGAHPEGWKGWPEGKRFALILMHDVETEVGYDKCHKLMELEEEKGFRSLFNFVPERYTVLPQMRRDLADRGFEVGVHGLKHDGKLFLSRKKFSKQAVRIKHYMKEWRSAGFSSPSMHRNLDWIHELEMEYDISTFDTDPFEPQPEGMATIFPFFVHGHNGHRGYVELPYTLPQDFTLFVLMREKNIDIWKRKLDWVVEKNGMALLITHPDYMNFRQRKNGLEEYPSELYGELLDYASEKYGGQYWHVLPRELACRWRDIASQGNILNVDYMQRQSLRKRR